MTPQRILLIPLTLMFCVATAMAQPSQLVPGSATNPDAVTLIYNPSDGAFAAVSEGADLTTVEIQSLGSQFLPEGASPSMSPFDLSREDKIFRLRPDGATTISFGNVLPPNLDAANIIDDLLIDGSMLGGGNLTREGGGPFLYVVPEPSGWILFGIAVLFSLQTNRRRWTPVAVRDRRAG